MKYLFQFLFSLMLINLYSCAPDEKDIIGTYTAHNKKGNIDTLVILSNGRYNRKLYSIKHKRAIFSNSNVWKYDAIGNIFLYEYLIDNNMEDFIITTSFPIKKNIFNNIVIDCSSENDNFFYSKIED